MGRPRKRHVQLELPAPPKLDKNGQHRGGPREGAGRPRKHTYRRAKRALVRHAFDPRHPSHVVLRVDPAIRSLRKRKMYRALRAASLTALRREEVEDVGAFRI